jgi:hypothetical protein
MSKINKTEKLPSCEVNVIFLKELEAYFFNELPKNIAQNKDFIEINYSISIEDNFGTEEIDTIAKYSSSKFTDSTTRISLYVALRASRENIKNIYKEGKDIDNLSAEDYNEIEKIEKSIPTLTINIDFRKARSFQKDIKIDFNGENARGTVIAVYDAIIRIFDVYKNHNYLYNISDGYVFILFYLNLIIGSISLILLIKTQYMLQSAIGLSFLIISIIYLTFARKTHPYFMFENKRSEKYKRWNNWFLYYVLFIVLINIILALLRKINYIS